MHTWTCVQITGRRFSYRTFAVFPSKSWFRIITLALSCLVSTVARLVTIRPLRPATPVSVNWKVEEDSDCEHEKYLKYLIFNNWCGNIIEINGRTVTVHIFLECVKLHRRTISWSKEARPPSLTIFWPLVSVLANLTIVRLLSEFSAPFVHSIFLQLSTILSWHVSR